MIMMTTILLSVSVIAECSYTFKQHQIVNYQFKCLDTNNNYCGSGTQLLISVEYPDGSNALNNVSMTYNPTYFNITLPTSQLSDSTGYSAIIVSPNGNATSEFSYCVTPSGFTSTATFFFIFIIIIGLVFTMGVILEDKWIMMLGSFLVITLGFFIVINGIDVLKDTNTTWAIGLVVWAIGGYFMFRSVEEVLKEFG